MSRDGALPGAMNSLPIPCRRVARPVNHYTPRVVPYHPEAYVPLENASILWFR